MSNTSLQRLCLIVSFLLLVPGVAAADGLFTLFAGATVLSSDVTSQSHTSVSYGGTLTFKSKVGVDIDWGYSNHITGIAGVDTDNARTFVVNFIADAGPKQGKVQPYVSGGGGLIALPVTRFADLFRVDSAHNDYAVDVGGGVMVSPGGRVGVRADVRYFRDVSTPKGAGTLNIWRITGGVTLRFGAR